MENGNYPPPPHPPPILTDPQLLTLAHQGHLSITLPPSLAISYAELSTAASTFFDQPSAIKKSAYPASQGTELGYNHIDGEKEYISLRCVAVPGTHLDQLSKKVWQQTAALLHRILGDLSNALNIDQDAWAPIVNECLSMPIDLHESLPTLLRIFRYFPESGEAARHTDLGLLTLCVGSDRGLQVLDTSRKQWVDAEGPTILIGQTLRALAQNRLRAGVHRVVGNAKGRSSIVFAFRASTRHEIDLAVFGGEGTVYMSEMWKRIRASNWNVNAPQDVRERQKVSLATVHPLSRV